MRFPRVLGLALLALAIGAVPSLGQAPTISFQYVSGGGYPASSTVTDPDIELVVTICSGTPLTSYTASLAREGQSAINVTLVDGMFGICKGGLTPYAYLAEFTLYPGDNTLTVYASNSSGPAQNTRAFHYIPPYRAFTRFTGNGGPRLTPGAKVDLPFLITNTGSANSTFSVSASCSGPFHTCTPSSSSTAILAPSESETITVSVKGGHPAGTGTMTVIATPTSGSPAIADTATASLELIAPAVVAPTVTAAVSSISATNGYTAPVYFRITNLDAFAARTLTPTVTCTGGMSCSSLSSIVLAASHDTTVKIQATWPGSALPGGSVVQLSVQASNPTQSANASTTVSTGASNPSPTLTLTTSSLNPGTSVARDQCLSIFAGDATGVECGALRAAHGFDGIRSMGSARAPTLLYLSDHAQGRVRIAAQFKAHHLATTDSLHATLTISGVGALPVRKFAWAPECANVTGCRIVFPVSGVASSLPTGVYSYSLQVRVGASGSSQSTTGKFALINDSQSPFGAGWWLEGLERLVSVSSTEKLWIGGDGSTRLYVKQNDSVYTVTDKITRPDTLKKLATKWQRRLRNGGTVEFDVTYRHVKTQNRQGHSTSIVYSVGSTIPDSIILPVPSGGPSVGFGLRWIGSGGSARLAHVVRTWASGAQDSTTVTIDATSRQLNLVREPAGDSVRFSYASSTLPLLVRRYNRLRDSVSFRYDSGYAVSRVVAHLGSSDSTVSAFCAAESRSLASCPIDVAGARPVSDVRAVTVLDGPRTDLSDLTYFYVGRFGAPDSIVDALGGRTRVSRGDASFPALVTQVIDPAGLVTQMKYTNRGLPDTVIVVAPFGGSNAVTTYEWDTKWDMMTRVKAPTGEETRVSYHSTTGNRVSQKRGTSDSTAVYFGYDIYNRLSWVNPPLSGAGNALEITYDSILGNVWKSQSAMGFVTEAIQDGLGRDTLVITPTDSLQTLAKRTKQRIRYDSRGRVDREETIGAAQSWNYSAGGQSLIGGAAALTAIVETTYDVEARPLTVTRSSSPAGVVATSYMRYDALGRLRAKGEDGTYFDSLIYDPAGNLTRTITRRSHHVRQSFDALNRLVSRRTPEVSYSSQSCMDCTVILPHPGIPTPVKVPYFKTRVANGVLDPDFVIQEEFTLFGYDAAGRMTQADNRDARIRRAYFANGALKVDTLAIRSADITHVDPPFTSVLTFTYDLSGRRTARSDTYHGKQTYTYDILGQLASTKDSVGGQAVEVTFAYDSAGRLVSQSVPSASTVAAWEYDIEGRPVSRSEEGFTDTFRYDARGKRIAVVAQALLVNGVSGGSLFGFDGLGQLVSSVAGDRDFPTWDSLHVDAHGNTKMRYANRNTGYEGSEQLDSSYYDGSRLRFRWGSHFPEGLTGPGGTARVEVVDSLDVFYDFSGNVSYQRQIRSKWLGDTSIGYPIRNNENEGHSWTWHFYDADQRLRATQRTRWFDGPQTDFEEFWYDALGRRVAVRARADSATCYSSGPTFPERCYQPFVRYIWDGDQIFTEDRGHGGWQYSDAAVGTAGATPWYGKVRYTQTGAIDAPVVLWLNLANPRVLHRNWRGNVAGATFVNGDSLDTDTVWPAAYGDIWMAPDAPQEAPAPNKWLGSLVVDSKDATGSLYRRNRYYDPVTGRFTQEDPIGLAGGMNLYGYAAGDPINNVDPFGLDPEDLNKVVAQIAAKTKMTEDAVRAQMASKDGLALDAGTTITIGGANVTAEKGNSLTMPADGSSLAVSKVTLAGDAGKISGASIQMQFNGVGQASTAVVKGKGGPGNIANVTMNVTYGNGVDKAPTAQACSYTAPFGRKGSCE